MSVTTTDLTAWKARGQPFVMLTAYDAQTARVLDDAGIPVLLVGDSVGNNPLGYETTLPVTMAEMLICTAAVARGARNPLLVADLPFGSYQASVRWAVGNAAALVKAGANAVKLEGGAPVVRTVRRIVAAGIPVMGHLGLVPQSVNAFGGFKVQGRGEAGDRLLADAERLQEAGCFALVLEAIPAALAARVTASLDIPTIGIGAGRQVDGQVLVTPDLLGLSPDPTPRFVKRYADLRSVIAEAAQAFTKDVVEGAYPGPEHEYR